MNEVNDEIVQCYLSCGMCHWPEITYRQFY